MSLESKSDSEATSHVPQLTSRRRKLLVKRLRWDTVKEDIEKEFSWFGDIEYVRYRNGHQRAIVCYHSPEHANSALKYFQTSKFKNGFIKVEWAHITKIQTPISNNEKQESAFSEKLEDLAKEEREILAALRKSWKDYVESVQPSQDCITFHEILKCLEKIPYEMVQDATENEFFQEEMEKLRAIKVSASASENAI